MGKRKAAAKPSPPGRGQGEGLSHPLALPPEILARCRELRREQTDAEKLLWHLLRDRQLDGAKFRRQHPVGRFILDFYCEAARLGLELDGGQHNEDAQARQDAERSRALAAAGIRVLRFWNNDVLGQPEAVLTAIWNELPHPKPSPPGRGQGEGSANPSPPGRGQGEGSAKPSPRGRGRPRRE